MKDKITDQRTPIERASGFYFERLEDVEEAFEDTGEHSEQKKYLNPPVYTRYGNPTVHSAEKAVKKLEGCE